MPLDIRTEVARYYDACPDTPADVPFYRNLILSPTATVLELGCGTGRVLVPLSEACGFIAGIDSSEAMLSVCREKLTRAGIGPERAAVRPGDISSFSLKRDFDLIIAPYRVLQNLEADEQIEGVFRCVRSHLASSGTCILNVFQPMYDREKLRRDWCRDEETFCWQTETEQGRITCHDRRPAMDRDRCILYPELIYRRYEGDRLVDESVLKIAMRCWYPQEFRDLITGHGYRIVSEWGGYGGEMYGQGPELVIQFEPA